MKVVWAIMFVRLSFVCAFCTLVSSAIASCRTFDILMRSGVGGFKCVYGTNFGRFWMLAAAAATVYSVRESNVLSGISLHFKIVSNCRIAL